MNQPLCVSFILCVRFRSISCSSRIHVTCFGLLIALFLAADCVFMFSWQRLHRELPLSAQELEDVFDSLDSDHTGYLTLEAFSSGFSRCSALTGL